MRDEWLLAREEAGWVDHRAGLEFVLDKQVQRANLTSTAIVNLSHVEILANLGMCLRNF